MLRLGRGKRDKRRFQPVCRQAQKTKYEQGVRLAFRGPGPPCHAILVGARDLYHSRWMGHSGGSEVGGLPGRRNRELLAPQGPKVAQLRAGRPGKPIDRALQEASGSRTSMDRDCRCQKLANGEGEQVCGCVLSEEKYCAISPLVGL